MVQAKPTIVELEMNKLEELLQRLEAKALAADDYETIQTVIEAYVALVHVVGDKNTTIRRLRNLLFGARTEKTAAVIGAASAGVGAEADALSEGLPTGHGSSASRDATKDEAHGSHESRPEDDSTASPNQGHGRNGAEAYTGAEKIELRHESLRPGDPCPTCEAGTLYDTGRPGILVRLVGQAPVGATIYYLQKLRCGLCGALFTAALPEDAGDQKCDATVGSMIALLRYGTGMPFHRAETLQAGLGIPLPASTQWDIVEAQAKHAEWVFEELVCQAAQGDVVFNDDTTVRILEVMGERARQAALAEERGNAPGPGPADPSEDESVEDLAKKPRDQRTGTFTSGIVMTRPVGGVSGHRIALFFSGTQHAGENLKDVLSRRAAERAPPIQMCDALARNLPQGLQTILGNCLAHGRRQFVDVVKQFPDECRHVLESLAVVYRNDALAREQNLSAEDRLSFHQAHSGPVMEELRVWLAAQFDGRRVEPNSALGGAMSYLLKRWDKLTLFLRVPGAPLDNNICERALKKAIRHRRNSLFYKTRHGAHVGDVFMSLIHTCELNGENPFEYLTALERHADLVAQNPQDWLPWNYRQTLAALAAPSTAAPASAAPTPAVPSTAAG